MSRHPSCTFAPFWCARLLAAVFLLIGGAAPAAPLHEVLQSYEIGAQNPDRGNLFQAPDGFFYGTTSQGGAYGQGTIFKISSSGVTTVLVHFTSNGATNKGSSPLSNLVPDSTGALYGTTLGGGATDNGTIFKVTTAGVLTTLVEFTDNGATNKGAFPRGGLVLGSDGNFYGTTSAGGVNGFGTVFKVTPTGTLTTLVSFSDDGTTNKGAYPYAGLYKHSDGSFYGSTSAGGANGFGTVFKVTSSGTLTTLLSFTDNGASNRGSSPASELVLGDDGSLYGSTQYGGANDIGTIFKMTTAGVLTTLVDFTGDDVTNKGANPVGPLVKASGGVFYGTTPYGGPNDFGTVFKVTSAGTLTTLVLFTGSGASNRGANPAAGLVIGTDGNFYGTTQYGGNNDYGTIFKMTAAGTLTTLIDLLSGGSAQKGAKPLSGMIRGTDNNFYGMTSAGGIVGAGTVYKLNPSGVTLTNLLDFSKNGVSNKGSAPNAALVQGLDGNFYGSTSTGGTSDLGTIFKVTPTGTLTTLVNFNGTNGSNPSATLYRDTDGTMYGTTYYGGANDAGTVFKVTTTGTLTTLVNFTDNGATNKGMNPAGGLLLDAGSFYGTTYGGGADGLGTIFKMTPTGTLTTLVEFTGDGLTNKGASPAGNLIKGNDGNFYGTTNSGGTDGFGTIFKMTSAGALTTILQFSDNGASNKGAYPSAGLVKSSDGTFYGVTQEGGANGLGTVFRMTTAGVLTTIFEFTGPGSQQFNGARPAGALFMDSDTNLYGTTSEGGAGGGGTLFRVHFGPSATTQAAAAITSSGAQLKANVNPNGTATNVVFEWGTSSSSLTNTATVGAIGSGGSGVNVTATLTGLTPATTYFYRVKADNADQLVTQRGATMSFTTTTTGVNQPPDAVNDGPIAVSTTSAVTLNVLSNDTDPNLDALTITAVTTPAHGTAAIINNGTAISYDPVDTYLGTDSFNYTISDGRGGTDTATVSLNMSNSPPDAVNDGPIPISPKNPVGLDVLANDTDVNSDPFTIISVTTPGHGTATITNGGTAISYDPDDNYLGNDSFSYTIRDSFGGTDTATVSLNIVNTAPDARNDGPLFLSNPIAAVLDVLSNDFDADSDPLTIVSVTTPGHGTATIVNGGGAISYDPDDSFLGTDTFTYTVSDGRGLTDVATVTVILSNDPPDVADDGPFDLTSTGPVTLDLLANDGDADLDPLVITAVSTPAHGTATITPDGSMVVYDPVDTYIGPDAFTYTVSDGRHTVTGNVTVNMVNTPPDALDDGPILIGGTTATPVDVLTNDTDEDGDSLKITAVTTPAHGTAVITGGGTGITYDPVDTYAGVDNFTYTVSDGRGGTDSASVSLSVNSTTPLYERVAMKGQMLSLTGLPFTAVWSGFGVPSINNAGQVAYLGKWAQPSGSGIFRDSGGNVVVMATAGQSLAGGLILKSFGDPVLAPDGAVAFLGKLAGGGVLSLNDSAIGLATSPGAAMLIAREGDPAPGTGGATFRAFKSISAQAGEVVFMATLNQGTGIPSTISTSDTGIWSYTAGLGLQILVREGQNVVTPFGAKSIKAFKALAAIAGTPAMNRNHPGTDEVVIQALFADGTAGILSLSSDGITVPSVSGQFVGAAVPGAQWKAFGIPCASSSTNFAVQGTLLAGSAGVIGANSKGIFTGVAGSQTLVARLASPTPDIGGGFFKSFLDPIYSAASSSVAFASKVVTPGVTSLNDDVLYFGTTNNIHVLARESDPAPNANGAIYKSFKSLALFHQNGSLPIWMAQLMGPGVISANDLGVWARTRLGSTALLLREGDPIDFGSGARQVKTFTILTAVSGSPGVTRSVNSNGQIIARVNLIDGTQVLVKITVP